MRLIIIINVEVLYSHTLEQYQYMDTNKTAVAAVRNNTARVNRDDDQFV